MAYEKLLNEIYAVAALKYLWPGYQPGFVKSESPDWLNVSMEFGMEVSQALLPDDGQEESFLEQYLGCKKEELPESAILRYGKRLHYYNGRFWAILPAEGAELDCLSKAAYRFDCKLKKLNSNYFCQKRNALYLILHPQEGTVTDPSALIAHMKEKMSDAPQIFHTVFLDCEDVLFVCNFPKGIVKRISISRKMQNFLADEAEKYRFSCEWKDGAEFV